MVRHAKFGECEDIKTISYSPAGGSSLGLETMSMSELRSRVGKGLLGRRHRVKFYLLILVTDKECVHWLDANPLECRRGSVVLVNPGQLHCFDSASDWDGWVVLIKEDFVSARSKDTMAAVRQEWRSFGGLPQHLILEEAEQNIFTESIFRMRRDMELELNMSVLNILLRNEINALIDRLCLKSALEYSEVALRSAVELQRFERFRAEVERVISQQRRVADYANALGCSEKSLGRAVLSCAGISPKAYISERVALEAKRYLLNTHLPVSVISAKLGFSELTNFIKFFKREVGCTPRAYRESREGRAPLVDLQS